MNTNNSNRTKSFEQVLAEVREEENERMRRFRSELLRKQMRARAMGR